MEDAQSYARRLETSLDEKRDHLDRVELPKLKDDFKLFQTSFEGIYNLLLKKGVIHEDPYKFELKISEVTTPPESPFTENEKIDALSVRLSQFESYLDFLNNYYKFSVDFLSMGRVKRLISFVRYFNFTQFSSASSQINTRYFAELFNMVKNGSDKLSSDILNESLGQLDKATRTINDRLKDLAFYHRERYKLTIRDVVMVSLKLDTETALAHKDEALRQIKRKQAEVASDLPFYSDLVEEILREDFSSDGPGMRDEIIAKLAVQQEKKQEKKQDDTCKMALLEGIRCIVGITYSIDDAIQKLNDNSNVLESRQQSFMTKLKNAFRHIFNPEDKGLHYEIEIMDTVSGQKSEEIIDFSAFLEDCRRKSRNLSALVPRNGPVWKRLETAPDEQDYQFLERTMSDVQKMTKRMEALDSYFKAEVPAADRSRLKGIKTELLTIRGALIKANQKKHEYVAQKEEKEQMHKLGIDSN